MVEVRFWECAGQRKRKEEPIGIFNIPIEPEQIPEVSENLKGKTNAYGEDMYEAELARREERVSKAILNCKNLALDKVRRIVGYDGVLVANIVEEEE